MAKDDPDYGNRILTEQFKQELNGKIKVGLLISINKIIQTGISEKGVKITVALIDQNDNILKIYVERYLAEGDSLKLSDFQLEGPIHAE